MFIVISGLQALRVILDSALSHLRQISTTYLADRPTISSRVAFTAWLLLNHGLIGCSILIDLYVPFSKPILKRSRPVSGAHLTCLDGVISAPFLTLQGIVVRSCLGK
ncbi:hypothetical protein [Pseudomonas luteola]|uniref:hypothetical protein n=1 Tax=Pseudomonas luteola TaxID=47886 RepID=UPI001FCA95AB|nr:MULTISPECIES: hypothetical protein [Pseudomonas]